MTATRNLSILSQTLCVDSVSLSTWCLNLFGKTLNEYFHVVSHSVAPMSPKTSDHRAFVSSPPIAGPAVFAGFDIPYSAPQRNACRKMSRVYFSTTNWVNLPTDNVLFHLFLGRGIKSYRVGDKLKRSRRRGTNQERNPRHKTENSLTRHLPHSSRILEYFNHDWTTGPRCGALGHSSQVSRQSP